MAPRIPHPTDGSLDHVALYDQVLPLLRGTASCARALSLAVARNAMSGEQASDGLMLVAQGLNQVLALLEQWYEVEATPTLPPSPDDCARYKRGREAP